MSVWLKPEFPTAQTFVAETAATPLRTGGEAGLGLLTTLQLVPFQCSITVCPPPPWVPSEPTTPMSQTLTADTAPRPSGTPGLGLFTTLQLPQISEAALVTLTLRNSTGRRQRTMMDFK